MIVLFSEHIHLLFVCKQVANHLFEKSIKLVVHYMETNDSLGINSVCKESLLST